MFKVLKKVNSLTKKQQGFLKSKKVILEDSLPNVLNFTKTVMAFDKEVDAVIGMATLLSVFSGLFTLLAGGIFITSSNSAALIATVLLLVLFVYCLKTRMKLGNVNISDELKDGVCPFLSLMKNDVKKNSTCKVVLNLTGPMDKKKLVQTLKIHRGKNYIYKDTWFSGEMTLGDGSQLTWNFEDETSLKKYSKTNPRGKVKYKSKVKMKSLKTLSFLTKTPNQLQETRTKTPNSALTIKKRGGKTFLIKTFKSKKIVNKRKLSANECTDTVKSLFQELTKG